MFRGRNKIRRSLVTSPVKREIRHFSRRNCAATAKKCTEKVSCTLRCTLSQPSPSSDLKNLIQINTPELDNLIATPSRNLYSLLIYTGISRIFFTCTIFPYCRIEDERYVSMEPTRQEQYILRIKIIACLRYCVAIFYVCARIECF